MADADEKKAVQKKPRSKRGCLARLFFGLIFLLLILAGAAWYFLPQIAERVMHKMLAEANLQRADFKIRKITWNSATLEKISLADESSSLRAEEMRVEYAPLNLFDGRVGKITLSKTDCDLVLPEKPDEEKSKTLEIPWITDVPGLVERIGILQAKSLTLNVKRGEREFTLPLNILLQNHGPHQFGALLRTPDFNLTAGMASGNETTALTTDFSDIRPARFLELVELILDHDGHLLPDGIQIGSAELAGKLIFQNKTARPLSLRGTLRDVRYDDGKKPLQLVSETVAMKLTHDFGAAGSVAFSGGLQKLAVPLDPAEGTAFSLQKNSQPQWHASIGWGGENNGIEADLQDFALAGTFQKIPLAVENLQAELSKSGNIVSATARLISGKTSVPVSYRHQMEREENDAWDLAGTLDFDALALKKLRTMPPLADAFDGITLGGEIAGRLTFKIGSQKKFSGQLDSKIQHASITVGDLVSLEGIDGSATLNFLPASASEANHFRFKLSGKKLRLGSEKALAFDLFHDSEPPLKLSGKGSLGEEAKLEASIKNLSLHGAAGGKALALNDTSIALVQSGDKLSAKGFTKLKGNTIPFSYQHEKKPLEKGWELDGAFEIKAADLDNPVDGGSIPLDLMSGKSLSGRVAVKMDFSMGSEQDFDGTLRLRIQDGKLVFADEGPVIEGIKGELDLSSLKNPQSTGFQRFVAKKMTVADLETSNLRLDVKLLPKGGTSLRNIALGALGGVIWADPFVIPSGGGDYKFTLHAKQLELPKLIALFPDFNGRVRGSIDGILPVARIDGEFVPKQGGMALSPGKKATLSYDAGKKFSGDLQPDGQEYQQMRLLEKSLKALDLEKLQVRLFDPADEDKFLVIRLEGQAKSMKRSPPIILNVNAFKPDDDSANFFDLLFRHHDKLDFGL